MKRFRINHDAGPVDVLIESSTGEVVFFYDVKGILDAARQLVTNYPVQDKDVEALRVALSAVGEG